MQQTEEGHADPRVVAGFAVFAQGAGALAAAVALVVLLGWGLDVALLHARAGDLLALRQELRVLMLLRNHTGCARAWRGGITRPR